MTQDRSCHSLLTINGSLIAVGGDVGTIEEYNIANDTWSVKHNNFHDIQKAEGGFIMMIL